MASVTGNNLGPLTTTFSVPKSCSSTFLGDNGNTGPGNIWIQFGTVGPNYAADCFPENFSALDPYYYSPGVCPLGYTVACAAGLGDGATVGTCCPTGYGCVRGRPGHESNACRTVLSTDSYFSYSVALTTSAGDYPRPQSSTTQFWAAGAGVFARGPVIRRSGSDPSWPGFPVQTETATTTSSLISSTMAKNRDGGAEVTATPTAGPSATGSDIQLTTVTQPASNDNYAWTGDLAKIGIGVGVPVGVLALIGIAALLIWRRRRAKKTEQSSAVEAQQKELQQQSKYYPSSDDPQHAWHPQQQQQQQQRYGYPQIHEKPASSGPWIYPEAQGNPVSELQSGIATRPVELDATRRY
ncbi:hypothetical protein PG995_005016 [Apiospora arundinis]